MKEKQIFVTQPYLPPFNEFTEYLEQIWNNKILTNNGSFHQQFELELAEYLKVNYVSLFANGTLALLTALKALNISGEVITTPFSFVATSHSILWNNLKPVFADIDLNNYTLDPIKIEKSITSDTTAILPVHVYGYPCNVDEIKKIADNYGLKVIYDAAHTFGAKYDNTSLCTFGDLSILSFHATKVFNTFEGGAIICHDANMKQHIDNLKNFGFKDETTVAETGINAKMNEFQAALGLLQLKYFDNAIEKRRKIYETYVKELDGIPGLTLPPNLEGLTENYAYFPILIDKNRYGKTRDELYEALKSDNIYCRRYFYPLISSFPMYKGIISAKPENLPIAQKVSEQVLCLPIYPDLSLRIIELIIELIKKLQA
jgi:dTDP-4-amino-4,6-dideoxygalactose transaminase